MPITITALDGEELRAASVLNPADLTTLVPSVDFDISGGGRQQYAKVKIRAQAPLGCISVFCDEPAGIISDGVYYARSYGVLGNYLDVESIEVVEGPQGTLFGRNTTGGAIIIRNRRPTKEFGGWTRAAFGNYNQMELQGALNVPFGDTVAMRVAVSSTSSDSYISNVAVDGKKFEDEQQQFRAILRWQPSDTLSFELQGDYRDQQSSARGVHIFAYRKEGTGTQWLGLPTVLAPITDLAGRVWPVGTLEAYVQRQIAADSYTVEMPAQSQAGDGLYRALSLNMDKEFEGFDLRWLNAYQTADVDTHNVNGDGNVPAGPMFTIDQGAFVGGYYGFQSELTLTGNASLIARNLSWTAGLFYWDEWADRDDTITWRLAGNSPSPLNPFATGRVAAGNKSLAGYAQGVYSLTDRLRATLGARYTYDEREMEQRNDTGGGCSLRSSDTDPNSILDPCFRYEKRDYNAVTWTAALDYTFGENKLVYLTARKGYKAGALNALATTPGLLFAKPEYVYDLELGFKADWTLFGMPVRTNLNAFMAELDDKHVQFQIANVGASPACIPGTPTYPNNCGAPQIVTTLNAKESETYGGGFNIDLLPTDRLKVSLNGAMTAGKYLDFDIGTLPPGYDIPPNTLLARSNTYYSLPQWKFTGVVSYELPISSLLGMSLGAMTVRGDYYHRPLASGTDTVTVDPIVESKLKPVELVNLRLDIDEIANTGLSLSFSVRNLFDEEYYVSVSGPGIGQAGVFRGIPGEPRMYYGELYYSFE